MPRDPKERPLDDRIRVQHMLDAARQARGYVSGRDRADLGTDSMLTRALLHAIQEIGEAASRVSRAGRDRAPDVPWMKIVGMRHRLVHGYSDVDLGLVWTVATRDLPVLISALEAAIVAWPLPGPPRE